MQSIIYAGMRNGERDQKILEALTFKHVKEVAADFKLAPSTIRSIAKRIEAIAVYDLSLMGGGSPIRIGQVAADSFRKAALGAYRNFHGTFRNLELSCWKITDGENAVDVAELRLIDTGEKPL
ncbi:hypothetical protein PSCICO_47890 [Pseudomonas cichorii]|uniref:hypothetical protein n=1 Tax=Pseudomonas cichorii TaxID=36746 RepID=UPI00190FE34A|nr:hypothetical protein [Pseudomonas cichorii]GFM89390.1 hypothetical protein PSCICO_47890 [Pseudomonas cichorii]